MSLPARVLREPLLHFFALGLLIFLLYTWQSGEVDEADAIVISRGQQTNLLETFERTWGRPPTQDEFRGLVQEFLREEIAYREASSMELDRNDTVIRRRLRQKLELLAEDLATIAPPTQSELEASYAANGESFRTEARYSFEQIDFSADRRGDRAESDARALLATLQSGEPVAEPDRLGDSRVLPAEVSSAGEREIAATFGDEFAAALAALAPGQWSGPVRSGFGWHLVRLAERVPGQIPPLAEVEERVRNELLVVRRREALDALYANLAAQYSIQLEPLTLPDADATATGSGE
jgi:hypothetical protein